MNPEITVIMPSLNVMRYIVACMDSVRNQSLKNTEILCIDAGSTDGTLEYLQSCAEQDERIRLIRSDRKSYGYQVNVGIREAQGAYIAIVETDDYIDREMFQSLYSQGVSYGLDFIKSDFEMIYEDCPKKEKKAQNIFKRDSELYRRVITPADYNYIFVYDQNIWKGLYRREFLLTNEIMLQETHGAAYQDLGFTLQVLQSAQRAMYIPEAYYKYRFNREDASSVNINTLRYVRQEFAWLFENHKVEKTEGIYNRLACSFIGELNKALIKSDYDICVPYISEPYVWIKKELKDAIEQGQLNRSFFSREMWHEIVFALYDLEGYASYLRFQIAQEEIQKGELAPFMNEKKLIVFGCGVYGKRVRRLFLESGREITFFADNDSRLWGQEIEGITVLPPEQCYIAHKEAAYVVASKKYAEEIYEQLCMNGIRKIYIWK